MVAIPFPLSSSPGKVPHESAGRLINAYWEPLAAGARAPRVWRRAPGLRAWATTGLTGPRGSLLVGATLYAAFAGNVSRFDAAGTRTTVGSLAGTAKVFWARNLKNPTPDVVVVDPDNGAFLVTPSNVTSYPDADLPAVNSVCFIDGYFMFTTGDGRCFASALNDTAINPSTFITAEGKPDGLLRAVAFTDLYLAGSDSIEVWHDTAEPAPAFPFSRLAVIRKGVIGRYAISGFENGLDDGILFVGSDKVVYALEGYTPRPISTPDVNRAVGDFIESGGDPSAIAMFPYVVGGHRCVVMWSPAWAWVFDLDTVSWFERQSYLSASWRATGSVNAFNRWIAGDAATGNLVEISDYARDELGDPLMWTVESGPVSAFPNRIAVAQASFDMSQGVGLATGADPMQTDPSVAISHSDDGGVSWSPPRIRKLGRQAESGGPIKVTKTGSTGTQGRRWRLQVSDAVDIELTGGDMTAEPRAA
jgi:hypothetical protein